MTTTPSPSQGTCQTGLNNVTDERIPASNGTELSGLCACYRTLAGMTICGNIPTGGCFPYATDGDCTPFTRPGSFCVAAGAPRCDCGGPRHP